MVCQHLRKGLVVVDIVAGQHAVFRVVFEDVGFPFAELFGVNIGDDLII